MQLLGSVGMQAGGAFSAGAILDVGAHAGLVQGGLVSAAQTRVERLACRSGDCQSTLRCSMTRWLGVAGSLLVYGMQHRMRIQMQLMTGRRLQQLHQ